MANDWGKEHSPREILTSLRNQQGEFLFNEDFLADTRRESIYNAMIGLAEQAISRHIGRANLAYKVLNRETVDENTLAEYGIANLDYEVYFRVIASNFYSALTHLTQVLLELRGRPEGAVASTLELLAEGQKEEKSENLEKVLNNVDKIAKKLSDFEAEFFMKEDFISTAVSKGYCNSEHYFGFQQPMDEITSHPHWGPKSNFYAHHNGQWKEVNAARAEFEPACRKLGIELNTYTNILALYSRFEKLEKIG